MKKRVALSRGINVGGHKSVKMEELDRVFDSLKFKNVKTLITNAARGRKHEAFPFNSRSAFSLFLF